MGKRLSSTLTKKTQEVTTQSLEAPLEFTVTHNSSPSTLNLSQIPEGDYSPYSAFSQFSEPDIARQLTIIEFRIFSKIKASELLNQAWNKAESAHKCRHISALISRANKLSFW